MIPDEALEALGNLSVRGHQHSEDRLRTAARNVEALTVKLVEEMKE